MARPRRVDKAAREAALSRIATRPASADQFPPPGTEAAIYARISPRPRRPGRGHSQLSIEEQARVAREACEQFGWRVKYVLTDRLESAKDLDRPQMGRLLTYVEEGRIGAAVVWKLDRLLRSLRDAVNLYDFFATHGVFLYSCTERFDNTTPFGRFVFRNLASAAELERELIRERTAMAAQARARRGEWVASVAPYGYRLLKGGRLEVLESEADVVRRIFGLYMLHWSIQTVAEQLNSAGLTARRGEPWTHERVRRVLRNPICTGRMVLAGVERYRPELKLVEPLAFEEASRTRKAVRHKGSGPVPEKRRADAIRSVFAEYSRILREQEIAGEILPEDPLGDDLARIKEGAM